MAARATLVSHQRWKLWLCGGGVALVTLGFAANTIIGRQIGIEPALVSLAASALGLVVLVAASLLIRCPSCGLSLVWYGVSKQSANAWLSWLLGAEVCPRCGFQHRSGDAHHDA